MLQILVKRSIEVLVFLLLVTFVSFLFARLAPGDPVLSILRVDDVSVTAAQVEALREDMGFNEPLLVQYGEWFLDFVRLDFGTSYLTGQPVLEMLLSGLPATLELTMGALIVMIAIALPLAHSPHYTGAAGSISLAAGSLWSERRCQAFGWGYY